MSGPVLSVEVAPTLADHVAYNEYILGRPDVRTRRVVITLAAFLLGPPIGLVLGFLLGYLTDPHQDSLTGGLRALSAADWREAFEMCAITSAALLAIALLVRLFRRPILRRKLGRLLKDRPGVDPNDPELREPIVVTFNDHGFSTKGTGTFQEVAWSVVRELVETRTLLILMVGKRIGFIVPKRDLSPAHTAAIAELARERAGKAG